MDGSNMKNQLIIAISGFGAYSDVLNNPSEQIVQSISDEQKMKYNIQLCQVVDVSQDGIDKHFNEVTQLYLNTILKDQSQILINLNFGHNCENSQKILFDQPDQIQVDGQLLLNTDKIQQIFQDKGYDQILEKCSEQIYLTCDLSIHEQRCANLCLNFPITPVAQLNKFVIDLLEAIKDINQQQNLFIQ